jgi:WD domain, G-beta repeat
MKRFALNCRPAIEQAPLQTYCSALIFAPDKSMVRQQFEDRIPEWMKRLPKVQEDWSASLQTLEGHTDAVWSVAFSRDGALLASGSWDSTVRVWDAATGAALKTLEGHTDSVGSVAFSRDGALLASASLDNTVRVWDAATGTVLQTIVLASYVNDISFTSDGSLLETDHGLLHLEGLQGHYPLGVSATPPIPQPHIFLDGNWILRDSEKLLRLPADYRGRCSAVRGGILVVGQSDGRVTFMEIG